MSWIQTAKVGDKVAPFRNHEIPVITGRVQKLNFNSVYTIREITSAVRSDGIEQIGIRLSEVTNEVVPSRIGPWELDYDYRHFRPVQPRQSDISIFKKMLNPDKAPVLEEV